MRAGFLARGLRIWFLLQMSDDVTAPGEYEPPPGYVALDWRRGFGRQVGPLYRRQDGARSCLAFRVEEHHTNGKSNADNKKVAGDWNLSRPVLNDANGAIGHAYGATNTPNMFIVNKGQLAYMGAIDDKRSSNSDDIAGAKNYVAKALDEILAGQSVSEPETKAYGCSVKYAN